MLRRVDARWPFGGGYGARMEQVPFTIPGWNRSAKVDVERQAQRARVWDRGTDEPGSGAPVKHLTWEEICRLPSCRGRWVALHECRYDERTGKATEGDLVDVDDDLATLCSRVRDRWQNCAILYVTPVAN